MTEAVVTAVSFIALMIAGGILISALVIISIPTYAASRMQEPQTNGEKYIRIKQSYYDIDEDR